MTKAHTTGTSKAAVKGTAHEMEGRKAPPFELPDGIRCDRSSSSRR
jgi:hypothetical protein